MTASLLLPVIMISDALVTVGRIIDLCILNFIIINDLCDLERFYLRLERYYINNQLPETYKVNN